MAAGNGSQRYRYRVILVAYPPEGPKALAGLFPAGRSRMALPRTVRVVRDRGIAENTTENLRASGAVVALVQELEGAGVFCPDHSDHLIAGHCRMCETSICAACMVAAEGRRLCARHRREIRERARWLRTRQLTAIFLFALFLYQVVDAWRGDQERTAMGTTMHVLVVQYAPESARYHPLLRVLNGYDHHGRQGTSLVEMKQWFDEEFRRYTGLGRDYMELHVHGPFFDDLDIPDLSRPGDKWLTQAWRSLSYVRFWRRMAREHGVDPKSYGAMLVVVYGRDAGDLAADSRASTQARLGVVHIELDDWNPTYPVITAAHELAHVFGATDRYDVETQVAEYPEGYVEPFVEQIFPQRYAELMAVDIPISRELEREAVTLSQVRVGHRTAAQLGWITSSKADLFYQPEPDPMERLEGDEKNVEESLDMTTPN